MNDAPVDVGIARTNSTNPRTPIKGVALPVTAVMAYLDHKWSKRCGQLDRILDAENFEL